jgi:16S rRNA processing protein RimM
VGAAGPEELLVVAELTRPHGIRGEVAARFVGVTPADVRAVPLRLRRSGEAAVPARIVSARAQGEGWILAIEGVNDRDEAAALRGALLLAMRRDLPDPEPNEWYVADIVGLAVVGEDGEELGILEEVWKLPANDVFVVRGRRGEVLVPVLEGVVVDVDARRMRVKLPPGLLDPPEAATREES